MTELKTTKGTALCCLFCREPIAIVEKDYVGNDLMRDVFEFCLDHPFGQTDEIRCRACGMAYWAEILRDFLFPQSTTTKCPQCGGKTRLIVNSNFKSEPELLPICNSCKTFHRKPELGWRVLEQ